MSVRDRYAAWTILNVALAVFMFGYAAGSASWKSLISALCFTSAAMGSGYILSTLRKR